MTCDRSQCHQEIGRGLRLVQTQADRWGVDSEEPGKTVWFEFDLIEPGVARSA